MPRIVIIGGGFGGLYAARQLKHADAGVTIVDRHNYHLFQPLLYQVATAALNPADIAAPIRSILRRQKNVDVLLGEQSEGPVHGPDDRHALHHLAQPRGIVVDDRHSLLSVVVQQDVDDLGGG